MRLPLLLIAATSACTPPSPWLATRAVCGFDDDEVLPWAALDDPGDGGWNGLVIDDTCAHALLGDLSADPDALLGELGHDEPLGEHVVAVRAGLEPLDGVTVAVWGMFWLLGADLGPVADVVEGPYVASERVAAVSAEAAEVALAEDAPLAQVAYDLVSGRTTGVTFLWDGATVDTAAAMEWWSRTLQVPRTIDPTLGWSVPPWGPDTAAQTLYHEAQHARIGHRAHVACEAPALATGRGCDADLAGAAGAGLMIAWAQAARAAAGADCVPEGHVAARTEALLRAEWRNLVMLDLPEPRIPICE